MEIKSILLAINEHVKLSFELNGNTFLKALISSTNILAILMAFSIVIDQVRMNNHCTNCT
jgi:hypothetical protein